MGASPLLLDLQALDLSIDRLGARQRLLETGDAIVDAVARADGAERALGELRLQLDVFDRDGTKLEHEIDSLSQKMTAEQRRMSDGSVANARELEAIGREIENLGRRKADREDQLLALMEQREEVERAAGDAEGQLAELRGDAEAVSSNASDELARVIAELVEKTAERALMAPRIDSDLLELYEDLRVHKKGVGAAALVDGVCGGCHERLSSVEQAHVKREGGIPRCEYCRRILVL
jgi:hypothetical protein